MKRARPFRDETRLTPKIDGAITTHEGMFATNTYRSWDHNKNPHKVPIYLRSQSSEGREHDMIDRELTLRKRGDRTNEHITSLNGIPVPREIQHDMAAIREYIFNTYEFGGFTMETILKADNGQPYQTKAFTSIYGGKMSIINKGTRDIPALSVLCWDIPDVDEKGYPIKSQSVQVSPTKAEILWAEYKSTVGDATRSWIQRAMIEYANTGRTGSRDHPVKEGASHLIDAILECASVVVATLQEKVGFAELDREEQLAAITSLIGSSQTAESSRTHGLEVALVDEVAPIKKQIINNLFFNKRRTADIEKGEMILGQVSRYQNGNAAVHFIEASNRINQEQNRRAFGITLEGIKAGCIGEVYVGRPGYSAY